VRVAISGADWPNTVAPPRPLTLEIVDGAIELPVLAGDSVHRPIDLAPGGEAPEGEAEGVTWRIENDVLADTTRAVIDHGGEYPTPYGAAREHYSGQVEVDRQTFAQRATARVSFGLDQPDGPILVSSDLEVVADEASFTVRIDLVGREGSADSDRPIRQRTWTRVYPRDLA
jgi:hypothetical protein